MSSLGFSGPDASKCSSACKSSCVNEVLRASPMARRSLAGEELGWSLFWAEAEYARSIVCSASGDGEGCVEALRSSLEALPTYAPAILSLGSVEYQLDRRDDGRRLLLDLPVDTQDLAEIIDKAGDFLISIGAYADGLELYRGAAERFPTARVLHQGPAGRREPARLCFDAGRPRGIGHVLRLIQRRQPSPVIRGRSSIRPRGVSGSRLDARSPAYCGSPARHWRLV